MPGKQNRNTDKQIQIALQRMVDHLIQSYDESEEVHLTSHAGDYAIQIDITRSNIQILVAHIENLELYAWTSYIRESEKTGIHHRHSLLSKHLTDLILLERMDVI